MILMTLDTKVGGTKTVKNGDGATVSTFELDVVGTMSLAVLKNKIKLCQQIHVPPILFSLLPTGTSGLRA